MNNRYIFRGKRKSDSEWIYGALDSEWALPPEERERYWISPAYLDDSFVIPETIGQCTGLKDKNGKLIFEGDVVNALFDFEMPIKSVCVFKDGSFGLLAKQHGAEHFHAFTSLCNIKYEVIGNIHDTPNLFKLEHDSLCETETYKVGDTE